MTIKLAAFFLILILICVALSKVRYSKDENLDGLFSDIIGKRNHYDDLDEDEEDDDDFFFGLFYDDSDDFDEDDEDEEKEDEEVKK